MKLYSSDDSYKLYQGNMLDMLEIIEPNSIDSIVTDPPYELGFMGKSWDSSGIAFQKETWQKCLQVLKPGGYLLAFGGSRTFHRIAVAIEDAGFEIRDTVLWLYGSGFPKSMNIGLAIDKKNGVESEIIGVKDHCKKDFKENNLYAQADANKYNSKCFGYGIEIVKKAQNEWAGWGTCLKPAYEPIIVARKPCEGTCVDNVLKWECGCINIDECRVPTNDYLYNHGNSKGTIDSVSIGNFGKSIKGENRSTEFGRFPANTILTYDETDYEEVCGGFPNGGVNGTVGKVYKDTSNIYGDYKNKLPFQSYGDSGSASRYFYCAKASKRDRDEGLEVFKKSVGGGMSGTADQSLLTGSGNIRDNMRKNIHPTVKPTDLMSYLVRLVTPNGGTILDPFNGSGSTGKAVMWENRDHNKGYKYIGIEMTEQYLPISQARIEYAEGVEYIPVEEEQQKEYTQIEKKKRPKQRRLF